MNTVYFIALFLVSCVLLPIYSGRIHRARRAGEEIYFPSNAQAREAPCSTVNGARGTCKPLPQCIQLLSDIETLGKFKCRLGESDMGICCPQKLVPFKPIAGLPRPPSGSELPPDVTIPDFRQKDIETAKDKSHHALAERDQLEELLASRGLTIQQGTPEDFHQNLLKTFNTALLLGREAETATKTASELKERFELTPQQGLGLSRIGIRSTSLSNTCPTEPRCPNSRYRTLDGSCNNLEHKNWGKSFTALERLLQPDYVDGVGKPRVSRNGHPLPSARSISVALIPYLSNNAHDDVTSLFIQFSQFLDHDLEFTPVYRGKNNTIIKCCEPEIVNNPSLHHPECFEIDVPKNDPAFRIACKDFIRSLPAPRAACNLGPREQMDQLTAFIDASMIYGSSDDDEKALRTFHQGKLRDKLCSVEDFSAKGNNEMVGENRPEVLQLVFYRLHNRLAEELGRLNVGWKDEELYQEARRIVGAVIQHITYNEYLPTLLGLNTMQTYKILPKEKGYTNDYNSSVNPSILNEFSSAAFHLHSLVQGLGEFYKAEEFPLSKKHTSGRCHDFNNFILRELSNYLLHGNSRYILDAASIIIQRGRDHGIRPYNDYRKFCGLTPANNFQDLEKYFVKGAASKLSTVYKSVDDIDLWVGGILEHLLPGAIVGPTFACIIGEQFRRTKVGDRFWYENGKDISAFSMGQLEEIRKISLARVLCDNGDNVQSIQPLAFLKPKEWNKKVSCTSNAIPSMNLRKWRNEPIWSK